MKKIAILRCLKSNDVCTGAGCLKAFNNREKTFARYKDEDVQLVAFFTCNGCEDITLKKEGLLEKMAYFQKNPPDAVHVGICAQKRVGEGDKKQYVLCSHIAEMYCQLKAMGIEVVDGTH